MSGWTAREWCLMQAYYCILCKMEKKLLTVILFVTSMCFVSGQPTFRLSEENLEILVGGEGHVKVNIEGAETEGAVIQFSTNMKDVISIPYEIQIEPGISSYPVNFTGLHAGHAILNVSLVSANDSTRIEHFVQVTVQLSNVINVVSNIMGWCCFIAWSASFYPQIFKNFKMKSVIGLNFDFLVFNIVGFVLYSLFNCGLYWIPLIGEQYMRRYPGGVNPVQLSDTVFSVHASVATIFTIIQFILFNHGNQKVSSIAWGILALFATAICISLTLACIGTMAWLDFLNCCSYIKLVISLIKQVPQAYMNHRRRSTEGWSIGNTLLDFTGGFFSIIEMALNSYNYSDWKSIFGDIAKFGISLISIIIDLFFMLQHYVLFKRDGFHLEQPHDNELPLERITTQPVP